MNLEKMIQNYKTETKVIPREEKILETIQKSKEVMMEVQSEHTMSYGEFLFSQFRLIRKRWWMLQAALLIVTFFLMNYLDDSEYLMRTLGTSSVLFIVMIIPEFWRNKESDSLQIEAACLYSLRQIYSARVFLIGVADVFMITLFMFVCCVGMRMQFMDILVQFLFPMVVAAGICFAMLNSSALNEAASMLGCFLWSVIWWMVTMNDFIYAKITFPVWSILFGLASCFLIGAVYKAMINMGFCEFRDFNYYRIDSLSKEEVGQIYENRGKSLEKWLNSEDADGLFDENEKAFLIEQYREMKAPLYYEDYDGWKSALSYAQTIIMLIMLVSAFLVSGIFSNEFSWKSDSIFFSTKYGRDRGTRAKIMAGFIVVSVIYFIVISLYSLVVLGCLGSQGGNVMIQTGFWHWKSFYNITYMQLYLLTVVAGYIGTVFCLFLSMLVSAKTHTAVVAVTIPFAILFLPLFVSNFDFLSGILGVFPDRLLQINEIINTFDLYHIGGKIVGSIPIMLVIYPILSILMVPLMYHIYHKTEIK